MLAASESIRISPDASGALATAMGPRAFATPTAEMLVGDAVPQGTWPVLQGNAEVPDVFGQGR